MHVSLGASIRETGCSFALFLFLSSSEISVALVVVAELLIGCEAYTPDYSIYHSVDGYGFLAFESRDHCRSLVEAVGDLVSRFPAILTTQCTPLSSRSRCYIKHPLQFNSPDLSNSHPFTPYPSDNSMLFIAIDHRAHQ